MFLPNFPIIVEINFDLSKQTPTSPKHISCSLEINNHVPLKYTSCLPYSPQNPWKTLRQISPCPVQSPIKSLPTNCDKRGTVPLLKVVRLVQSQVAKYKLYLFTRLSSSVDYNCVDQMNRSSLLKNKRTRSKCNEANFTEVLPKICFDFLKKLCHVIESSGGLCYLPFPPHSVLIQFSSILLGSQKTSGRA